MESNKIKVLLVDDHVVVRTGLAAILNTELDICVVGEASDGNEAITKAIELKPDVVVMDILMPNRDGIDTAYALHNRLPESKILILSVLDRESDIMQCIRFGVQGYILKKSSIKEISDAVRNVAAGYTVFSPEVASRVANRIRGEERGAQLSPREYEILQFIGDGLSNSDIADKLFISESTVRTYIQRLMEKLQLKNKAEVMAYAIRQDNNS